MHAVDTVENGLFSRTIKNGNDRKELSEPAKYFFLWKLIFQLRRKFSSFTIFYNSVGAGEQDESLALSPLSHISESRLFEQTVNKCTQ